MAIQPPSSNNTPTKYLDTPQAKLEKTAKEAKQEGEDRIDYIRDQYRKKETFEIAQQEDDYDRQRTHGYEAMRELKRQQLAELQRIRKEGENEVQKLQEHYRQAIHDSELSGNEKLKELRTHQQLENDFIQKESNLQKELLLKNSEQEKQNLIHQKNTLHEEMSHRANQQLEQQKLNQEETLQQSLQKMNETQKKIFSDQDQNISTLFNKANSTLNVLRKDMTDKLAAYSVRQNDPFYKLVDMNFAMEEKENEFIFKALIPPHEYENISVHINGNQMVISGNRSNSETLELQPGRKKNSQSYQSFNEMIPLSYPVDKNGITREYDGQTLTLHVPKQSYQKTHQPYQPKTPEKIQATRPQFPNNLPHVNKADA